ncbi:MAG TPA: acetyl-CoA carboxylase biotin carboxyl carrier protein [Planctomycetota bacterium]|jgi:acetyl-CoA carboxylase biotin carboxyl carrier protein
MDFSDVEKLILLMKQHGLSELQVKEGEWQFSARRGEPMPTGVAPVVVAAPVAPAPAAPVAPDKKLKDIVAPIVGTFYRSPAPDQPPYKEVGDRVGADDVVCIVEAMKVMNEIKAGVSGTIRKVLVDNATPVEFGQTLFQVETE